MGAEVTLSDALFLRLRHALGTLKGVVTMGLHAVSMWPKPAIVANEQDAPVGGPHAHGVHRRVSSTWAA